MALDFQERTHDIALKILRVRCFKCWSGCYVSHDSWRAAQRRPHAKIASVRMPAGHRQPALLPV